VANRTVFLRRLLAAAALLILNAALTFQNDWPTPAIRWQPALSVELAVAVLVLAAWSRRATAPRSVLRWLAAIWVLLAIGRYEYVTAPALFGRELNLYFDLRFLPDVTAMLARAAPAWAVALVVVGVMAVFGLLYAALRWAFGRVGDALAHDTDRRVLIVVSSLLVACFAAQHVSARVLPMVSFTAPVSDIYARQVREVVTALRRTKALPASPAMDASLEGVKGRDVLLIFVESYGAVSYERPELARGVAAGRALLGAAIGETGRAVVSAYVESPTFGGNSWLAHISLLAGMEIRDLDTSSLLMMQKRDTLVTAFTRRGYRAVAMMPGQREAWPEGSFYGFDEIYGIDRLNYNGPAFGWFRIPDQFTMARLDALETDRSPRAPLFVFFPTLSTHTPFEPIAPYQPDWARMTTAAPYDQAVADRALAREPNWFNLGASYVDALSYEFAVMAGYLRQHRDRDFVMILIGDHQPPAVVSGEGAPWDVPVHVITSPGVVLDRLAAHGFRKGLNIERPAAGKMHALAPLLLDAFSGGR